MKFKAFIKENTWLPRIRKRDPNNELLDFGWGNGYVVIPKGHKLNGVHYDKINVEVNGGLTFSNYVRDTPWKEVKNCDDDDWIVGFDTAHCDDTLKKWPKEAVMLETLKLKKQLEEYELL